MTMSTGHARVPCILPTPFQTLAPANQMESKAGPVQRRDQLPTVAQKKHMMSLGGMTWRQLVSQEG